MGVCYGDGFQNFLGVNVWDLIIRGYINERLSGNRHFHPPEDKICRIQSPCIAMKTWVGARLIHIWFDGLFDMMVQGSRLRPTPPPPTLGYN
jgi:hypothetical protein